MKISKRWIIFIAIALILVVLISAVFVLKAIFERDLSDLSDLEIAQIDLSKVKDGTYNGEYKIFPVSARVSVNISDGKISSIDLLEHNNGQGKPAEVIISDVLESQTINVDVISGATYSSKIILKSIEVALLKGIQN